MTTGVSARERRLGTKADPGNFSSGVQRYRDPRFDAIAVKVFPGEHYITGADELLVTVLGSCVSVCIRDPVARVGGMNNFMLPVSHDSDSGDSEWGQTASGRRYGSIAMERLINGILQRGGLRQRLEIKVFGGGNVLMGNLDIGHRNAVFVEDYFAAENLPITASHLRGDLPRRVHYFPRTGRVMLLELRRAEDVVVVELESRYKSALCSELVGGSAEPF